MNNDSYILLFDQIDLMNSLEPGAMTLIVDGPDGRHVILYLQTDQYYYNFNGTVRLVSYDDLIQIIVDLGFELNIITSIKVYAYGQFENIYGPPMNQVPPSVLQILIDFGFEDSSVVLPPFQATLDPSLTFNEDADECSICQESIYTDMCKNQNCRHYYHCWCITSWINHDRSVVKTCPVCRANLNVSIIPELYIDAQEQFSFGKYKKSVRSINKDIFYLKNIK